MKKVIGIILAITLTVATTVETAQAPRKRQMPNTPAGRRGGYQAKPMVKKNDKQLLEEQRQLLVSDKLISRFLGNHKELKNFCYNHVCPIKSWTQQDQINTARWIRKAYTIIMNGPDRVDKNGPMGSDFLLRIGTAMFMKSPYYLNLTKQQQDAGEPGPYMESFILDNSKKDMNNIKPAYYDFTKFST